MPPCPVPLVHLREGDHVELNVTNKLMDSQHSSIHCNGILVRLPIDGVPGIPLKGIPPGLTFHYNDRVKQAGTHWYHSHTAREIVRHDPVRQLEVGRRELPARFLGSASDFSIESSEVPRRLPRMKMATIIVRVLLGLMFVVFGSNAFLHFLPMPPMHGPSGDFMGAMNATGYLQAVAAFQVAGGALLLLGRYVPLGLTLLGPVIVNIVFYHIFMDRAGMGMALAVSALSLFLLWSYRSAFAGLVRP